MVNDKNHLYTPADLTREARIVDKIRTQQQFSRFSTADVSAINQSSALPPPTALQIFTKPFVGDPYNDTYGDIGFISQIIFLDVFGSNYNIISVNGDITFAFDKIPQGRHIEFTIDMLINTGTPPTIIFPSEVENPPTLPTLTDGLRVILHFEGVVDDVNTRFVYIGGTVDTAGAVTFPITPPVDVRGNVSTTQDIDLSLTTAHSTTMTLTGDISITFSNFPATANQIEWEIEITQDATGGHDVTSWPAGVSPIPVIDQTALATTLIVLRTNTNGTIINTLFASVGVISPVSDWANFPAVSDIDFATFDGINIDRLRFVIDSGVPLSAADPSIFLDATGDMVQNVAALDSIIWKANNIEMAKIIEAAAGVYRLDMLDHSIDNAQDIRFDDTSGTVVFAGTDPAIGYDSVAARLLINMPTGGNLIITNNNVIGTTQINNNSLTANVVNANDVLQLGVDVTVPSVPGEFRNDGTDVFVFSGGVVRNLSDITVGGVANQQLSNLSGTVNINLDLLPDQSTGGNLGSTTAAKNWFNVFLGRIRFTSKMTEVTTEGSIQLVNNGGDDDMIFNLPSATADRFIWDMAGSPQMTLTATQLQMTGIELDMENGSIFDIDQVQITGTSGDTVRGLLSGSAGIFDIRSEENASQIRLFTRTTGGVLEERLAVEQTQIGFEVPIVFTASDIPAPGDISIGNNGSDILLNVATGNRFVITIQGTEKFALAGTSWGPLPSGADMRLFCVSSGNKAPINLEPVAGDPTTVSNGDMWYNSTSNKMRIREGGVSKDMV